MSSRYYLKQARSPYVQYVRFDRLMVLLIKVADFYINNLTKLPTSQAPSFSRFDEQLLKQLYSLHEDLDVLMKRSFLEFMIEKMIKVPDKGI